MNGEGKKKTKVFVLKLDLLDHNDKHVKTVHVNIEATTLTEAEARCSEGLFYKGHGNEAYKSQFYISDLKEVYAITYSN